MSDRSWRWNLVLMGWTVTLLAAALVAWLFLHPATDRYQSLKAGVLDRATGESYFYSDQWPSGPGHISRFLASPTPRAAAEG